MATFKACVRSQRSDGLFAVLIRVTHNRVARYINTDKTVDKSKLRKGEIKDPEILSYCSNGSSSNLVVNSLSLYFQVNNYPFLLTFIRKYRH